MSELRQVPFGLGRLSSQSTIYGPDNVCLLPTTATGSGLRGPDITGTGTGPMTSESTPPPRATRATRPATYLSTRWGTDGHGSAGLPEISEDRAESAPSLLDVFYVCGAALCFSVHHNGGE